MNRAVFLDRDGVINKAIIKNGRPFSPRRLEELKLMGGIKEVLEKFKEKGYLNIVITNQPDIKRGLITWEEVDKIHNFLKEALPIDEIMICPHDDEDNCLCRKPKAGLLTLAAKKRGIDLKKSFLIGDQEKDIMAGKDAGCVTILLDYPYNQKVIPDYRVKGLRSALDIILKS